MCAGFPAEHGAQRHAATGEIVKRAILLLYTTGTGNHSRTFLSHQCFPRDARCQPLSSKIRSEMIPVGCLVRPTNLSDAITQVTSQERPQGNAISVADTRGDLIDTLIAGLQEMHCAFDPQALKIR